MSDAEQCPWCREGIARVRETLPNGEVIWAHWDGVWHECKAVSEGQEAE